MFAQVTHKYELLLKKSCTRVDFAHKNLCKKWDCFSKIGLLQTKNDFTPSLVKTDVIFVVTIVTVTG